jgi:putative endonuclease
MATRRMSVGRVGEDIAAAFLTRRGGVVLDRNLRVGRGEIDLLVRLDGERVAVEVKTALEGGDRPEENFDAAKERHVRTAARSLTPPVWRVDLIAVVLGKAGASVRWLPDVD